MTGARLNMKRAFTGVSSLLIFAGACSLPCPAQTFGTKQASDGIPFEFIHDAIVLQVAVNGHGPMSMLLDTGADPSLIDLKTAKEIGLKLATKGEQGSGGGTDVNLAYETVLPVIRIGGFKATQVDAVGMDLSRLSAALGRPISGVLGYSLLKTLVLQIDYPNHKVRFDRVAPFRATGQGFPVAKDTTLPFQYQDDIVATGVKVNGQPVRTNIDTGSNAIFQFTPAAVEKLGLSDDVAHAQASGSVGFNGALKNREGTVRNVTVGTISMNRPTVIFFGKGMGLDQEPWDLRVGNKFLKNYVMTVNFQLGTVTLAAP